MSLRYSVYICQLLCIHYNFASLSQLRWSRHFITPGDTCLREACIDTIPAKGRQQLTSSSAYLSGHTKFEATSSMEDMHLCAKEHSAKSKLQRMKALSMTETDQQF